MTLGMVMSPFIFIFGLLIGSFLNVVIYRLPLGLSVIKPRSSCPSCKKLIKWNQNIPLLSYFLQKGKCKNCDFEIPKQYPLVELAVGLFAFFLFPQSLDEVKLLTFVFKFSVACIFLAHFLIDIKHYLLPDKLNFYLLLISIPYIGLTKSPMYWLVGSAIGFFGPYLVTLLFYKIKGQIGLGGGDIKLFGILGFILGPIGVLNNIFLSCMAGSILGLLLIGLKKLDRNSPLAFGPYIIIAATIQIFFPRVLEFMGPLVIR